MTLPPEPDVIEAVARALHELKHGKDKHMLADWSLCSEAYKQKFRNMAPTVVKAVDKARGARNLTEIERDLREAQRRISDGKRKLERALGVL